jgi:penicillin-binding protein 1C
MEELKKDIDFVFKKNKPKKRNLSKTGSFLACLTLLICYYFLLPANLFTDPNSTLLLSKNGQLLSASIASDGQWRFPASDSVNSKMKACVLEFEDRNFYYHPGFNPFSLLRAAWQNVSSDRILSGGSTITMQVVRLSRERKDRTFGQKILEILIATRLELAKSKEEILALWCSHAPFGGNVVGLEAASWRYYGRSPETLSWAEAATLAVLPNAPSLIFPGKNHHLLLGKRNRLLRKLKAKGYISQESYELALMESLPDKPHSLPRKASHLLQTAIQEGHSGQRIISSLDPILQHRLEERLARFYNLISSNKVENACALIADVKTGKVLAYGGNIPSSYLSSSNQSGFWMDLIKAKRSYGSLLKPFLYVHALDEGQISPAMLLVDHPSLFGGYQPHNFSNEYEGAVPAHKALARSLNIPFVKLLKDYDTGKFQDRLKQWGIFSLSKPPDYYGLSLILGGGEASLWEMAGAYASMTRVLLSGENGPGHYLSSDIHSLSYLKEGPVDESFKHKLSETKPASRPSIYLTFEAMREGIRPGMESSWMSYTGSRNIAWKTGTSYGLRDAWCIGVTPDYVVAVWVGNASGEGRPGLTGAGVAAPLMFDLYSLLPATNWFKKPYREWAEQSLCAESGYLPGPFCLNTVQVDLPENTHKVGNCPYHHLLHLTKDRQFRADLSCFSADQLTSSTWFVLPPVMEYYYRQKNPAYAPMPSVSPICLPLDHRRNLDFIYPRHRARIYLTKQDEKDQRGFIAEVALRKAEQNLYWHLDNQYLGTSSQHHQMLVEPTPGQHTLTVVDENGESTSVMFEVLNEK